MNEEMNVEDYVESNPVQAKETFENTPLETEANQIIYDNDKRNDEVNNQAVKQTLNSPQYSSWDDFVKASAAAIKAKQQDQQQDQYGRETNTPYKPRKKDYETWSTRKESKDEMLEKYRQKVQNTRDWKRGLYNKRIATLESIDEDTYRDPEFAKTMAQINNLRGLSRKTTKKPLKGHTVDESNAIRRERYKSKIMDYLNDYLQRKGEKAAAEKLEEITEKNPEVIQNDPVLSQLPIGEEANQITDDNDKRNDEVDNKAALESLPIRKTKVLPIRKTKENSWKEANDGSVGVTEDGEFTFGHADPPALSGTRDIVDENNTEASESAYRKFDDLLRRRFTRNPELEERYAKAKELLTGKKQDNDNGPIMKDDGGKPEEYMPEVSINQGMKDLIAGQNTLDPAGAMPFLGAEDDGKLELKIPKMKFNSHAGMISPNLHYANLSLKGSTISKPLNDRWEELKLGPLGGYANPISPELGATGNVSKSDYNFTDEAASYGKGENIDVPDTGNDTSTNGGYEGPIVKEFKSIANGTKKSTNPFVSNKTDDSGVSTKSSLSGKGNKNKQKQIATQKALKLQKQASLYDKIVNLIMNRYTTWEKEGDTYIKTKGPITIFVDREQIQIKFGSYRKVLLDTFVKNYPQYMPQILEVVN